MTDQGFVEMKVECPRCKTKQKVLVVARAGSVQIGKQTIVCIKCKEGFDAMVPDWIVGGPLPT